MTSPKPHYLLFCDGNVSAHGESVGTQRGRWRFVLEDLASGERIEATDQEVACAPDRSALVAVLRGLEALEQPSRVTLVTTSRYVTRGLQYGLSEWRDNDYSWEHFGTVQPIRNADIWKRIDRALAFHQVQCRWMAQEVGTEPHEEPVLESDSPNSSVAAESNARIAVPVANLSAVKQSHRTTKKGDHTRSIVSASKYQRVYVDTPLTESVPLETNRPELHLNKQQKQRREKSFFKKISWNSNRIVFLFLLPIRLIFRGPLWLCRHFWAAILAVDEWLESFLRCLFLFDPGKRPTRH